MQLLAIANCRGSSSIADSSALAQLKVADPENRDRSKSRAIKGGPQSNQSQSSSKTLAKARRTKEAARAKEERETRVKKSQVLLTQWFQARGSTTSCLKGQNYTFATRLIQVSAFQVSVQEVQGQEMQTRPRVRRLRQDQVPVQAQPPAHEGHRKWDFPLRALCYVPQTSTRPTSSELGAGSGRPPYRHQGCPVLWTNLHLFLLRLWFWFCLSPL